MYSAFQLAKKYLEYYLHASNAKGHGVHSPFVFHFIKYIKNDQTPYACYRQIEAQRRQLLNDRRLVTVTDFGAGSAVIKSHERRIDHIAASSLKPKKFSQLLFRMVQHYQPAVMLELGTSFGITSAYLASANPNGKLYTLEGAETIAGIAQDFFTKMHLQNIELRTGDFRHSLHPLLNTLGQVDFAFVDGNHRKQPTLEYFRLLLAKCGPHSILVFDDIHWSRQMEEAWAEIKAHEAVTLSVDLFFVGIVFFRKDFKEKQQFSIRF